ncbi:pyridoxal phosphate-dependent aminotransferase [Pseudomonas vanderleydeniana]|uniref:Aminotransferase n=1 Tax=Pseudomonas vanderleydeniana TaxID=2745495 RepID=A0A9E6PKV2_9PSED|nr:histidinol-phosphate transaminase [Pseudomonas vanderleydeniana]QXI28066.1 histidinol-phosphate aminotransferase family protein [Pseudomonas vanderleydeniana]
MPRIAEHLRGLENPNPFPGLVAFQKRTGYQVQYRLGGNECLDAPLTVLQEHYGEEFCRLARLYGDPGASALRESLGRVHGIDPEHICLDSGADAVIALCLRALCVPGDKVVCTAGTYPTFGYFARAAGCEVIEVDYQRTGHSLSVHLPGLLQEVVRTGARVVYLANPDNPSGSWWLPEVIDEFCRSLPDDCTLLLDEAYLDFCADLQADSGRPLPGCIRIRSLSKAYGLAGLRLGFALADEAFIELLGKVRIHYAVGGLAQHAAQLVLDDPQHGELIRTLNGLLRNSLGERLREVGYRVLPSGTNFVSLLLPSTRAAQHLQEHLLEHHIAVHRPAHPAVDNLIRVTVCEAVLEDELIALFERAIA